MDSKHFNLVDFLPSFGKDIGGNYLFCTIPECYYRCRSFCKFEQHLRLKHEDPVCGKYFASSTTKQSHTCLGQLYRLPNSGLDYSGAFIKEGEKWIDGGLVRVVYGLCFGSPYLSVKDSLVANQDEVQKLISHFFSLINLFYVSIEPIVERTPGNPKMIECYPLRISVPTFEQKLALASHYLGKFSGNCVAIQISICSEYGR